MLTTLPEPWYHMCCIYNFNTYVLYDKIYFKLPGYINGIGVVTTSYILWKRESWTNLYRVRVMVMNATFKNISGILWRSVLLAEEIGKKQPTCRKSLTNSIKYSSAVTIFKKTLSFRV